MQTCVSIILATYILFVNSTQVMNAYILVNHALSANTKEQEILRCIYADRISKEVKLRQQWLEPLSIGVI